MGNGEINAVGGNPATSILSRGGGEVKILLVASFYFLTNGLTGYLVRMQT